MAEPIDRRVRLGLWALPAAGALYLAGLLTRGRLIPSPADPAFAEWISRPAFTAGWALLVVGSLVEVLGLWPLYLTASSGRNEPLSFFGMLATQVNRSLVIGLQCLFLAAPQQAGALLGRQGIPAPILALLALNPLTMLGSIAFGIALWRSGRVPKAAAALLALHVPLLAVGPRIAYPVEVLGSVALLAAGALLVRARPA